MYGVWEGDGTDVASVPVPKTEKGVDEQSKTVFEELKIQEGLVALTVVEVLEYRCPGCAKGVLAKQ